VARRCRLFARLDLRTGRHAELFTGNNLINFAWVDKKFPLKTLLRNWCLVYVGNLLGTLATFPIETFIPAPIAVPNP
ncbi:MAG: formate/nitrite transporter family protein, partial [Pseudomonadota bacterium]|nr:formate/nitrite transporter family protein [Pseudomonadota bacterium]